MHAPRTSAARARGAPRRSRHCRGRVLIRDAALFAGSDDHAESAGHILSLVASARLHHLDLQAYLRDMIRVLPFWPRDRYLELAPKCGTRTRSTVDSEQLAAPVGVIEVPPASEP